jgi:hypothetical protein
MEYEVSMACLVSQRVWVEAESEDEACTIALALPLEEGRVEVLDADVTRIEPR